jgi:hypothetical protein
MKIKFQIDIYLKTLLKAKRRISFRGSLYLVKGKAFEIGGEISNLENVSCNLIHIPLTICKKTLKRFSKRICKNKHVVQKWSKMLNKRKSNPFILSEIFNWFNSCTLYLLWFVLASITKKGEIEREIGLTISYD